MKWRSLVNKIAVAGIAVIIFIQGNLLKTPMSGNSTGPKKEDNALHDFIAPNLKHEPYNISQLPGLWKASQFTGMNSDISQKKIIVVVSHCNKPLHWMQDFIVNGSFFVISGIYIISKCGEQPLGAPEGAVVHAISNVGREDHTYAHFITEILPKEVGVGSYVAKQRESIVVFLQDDIGYNHQNGLCTLPHGCLLNLEELVRLASSSNGFGCWSSPPNVGNVKRQWRGKDASAYHNTIMLLQFEDWAYTNKYRSDNTPFKSSYFNLGASGLRSI